MTYDTLATIETAVACYASASEQKAVVERLDAFYMASVKSGYADTDFAENEISIFLKALKKREAKILAYKEEVKTLPALISQRLTETRFAMYCINHYFD